MYEDQKTSSRMQQGIKPHRKSNTGKMATTAALVIVVIAIIAYLAFSWHGVPIVSSNQTISLALGKSSYFKLKGQPATFAMFLENSSPSYATIYVSEVPVLTSSVSEFTVYNGSQANISTSLSPTADLAVKLVSSGNTTSKVELIPIPAVYKIRTSPSIVISNPASFYSGTVTQTPQPSTASSSSSSGTSSQPSGKTAGSSQTSSQSSSSNPPPTSTSAAPVKTPLENISSILNYTYIGSLMNNYSTLYTYDKACTAPEYNTSFLEFVHQSPIGSSDFRNATTMTPTGLVANATAKGNNNYAVTYSPIVSDPSTRGVAVSFNLDSSTAAVTNLKFSGIYQTLNYTSVLANYRYQKGISGSCGAYIP